VNRRHRALVLAADDPERLLDLFAAHVPARADKWIDRVQP
jgi:hypothetical protein